jgi:hypothetical protein
MAKNVGTIWEGAKWLLERTLVPHHGWCPMMKKCSVDQIKVLTERRNLHMALAASHRPESAVELRGFPLLPS